MAESSNHWRTFGIVVIVTVAVVGVLGVGFILGSRDDGTTTTAETTIANATITTESAVVTTDERLPSPATTTGTTTTQPAPPPTFFLVDHWMIDLVRLWQTNDPSLAAAWYGGSFPPASERESRELTVVKGLGEGGTRNQCESFDSGGDRFLDFVWPDGAYGVLDRLLTSDEATRMMHQMLQQGCPENA